MGNLWSTKLEPYFFGIHPDNDRRRTPITDRDLTFRFVERDEWNPKKPKYKQVLKTPVQNYLLRHFTNTEGCIGDEQCYKRLQEIQNLHMAHGLPDIAYNFLVGEDGTVYEGRGWTIKPSKVDNRSMFLNGKSIDIALIGDYTTTYPNSLMDKALWRLMRKGVELGYVTKDRTLTENREFLSFGEWLKNGSVEDTDPKVYDESTEPPPAEPPQTASPAPPQPAPPQPAPPQPAPPQPAPPHPLP